MVDEIIDDLLLIGLKLGSRKSELASEDIAWWIATGRAPTPDVRKLHDLKPEALEALVQKVVKQYGSTDHNVAVCKRYLKGLA